MVVGLIKLITSMIGRDEAKILLLNSTVLGSSIDHVAIRFAFLRANRTLHPRYFDCSSIASLHYILDREVAH